MEVQNLDRLPDIPAIAEALLILGLLGGFGLYAIIVFRRERLGRRAANAIPALPHLLWTGVWIGFMFKASRGNTLNLVAYGLAASCLLGLLIRSLTRRSVGRSQPFIPLLMFCFWAWVTFRVGIGRDPESIKNWIILTGIWTTLYRCARTEGAMSLIRSAFAGVYFVAAAMTLAQVGFTAGWMSQSIARPFRIVGPFENGIYLSHCLGIALIGICLRSYVERHVAKDRLLEFFWASSMVLLVCATLSRSGMVLGLAFAFVFAMVTLKRPLLFVFGGIVVAGIVLAIMPTEVLIARVEVGMHGREHINANNLHLAMQQPIFGHGYSISKLENFSGDLRTGNSHPSHNFGLAVFYDLGLIGVFFAVLLCAAVPIAYLQQMRGDAWRGPFLCAACWMLCFLVAMVENMFWDGNSVISILVILLMSLSASPGTVADGLRGGHEGEFRAARSATGPPLPSAAELRPLQSLNRRREKDAGEGARF